MPLAVPLHFVTPVWGPAYTRTFCDVMLPCMLSPGNIPSLPNLAGCAYKIYTTPQDAEAIVASASYGRLAKLLPVQVCDVNRDEENKYVASSLAYREAAAAATREGAAGVFLGPDVIAADGSIGAVAAALAAGKSAVLVMGVRAVKETLVPELLQRFSGEDCVRVRAPDLADLLLRHVHPISESHMFEGRSAGFHPAGFFWRVADEGLLMHCFHLHPVAVYGPAISTTFSGTIDDDLLAKSAASRDSLHVVGDSDEMLFVEVSAADYTVPTPERAGMERIAAFVRQHTNALHRELVKVPIRVHACARSPEAWRDAQARALRVVNSVLAACEALEQPSARPAPGPPDTGPAGGPLQRAKALEARARAFLERHGPSAPAGARGAAKHLAARVIVHVCDLLRP